MNNDTRTEMEKLILMCNDLQDLATRVEGGITHYGWLNAEINEGIDDIYEQMKVFRRLAKKIGVSGIVDQTNIDHYVTFVKNNRIIGTVDRKVTAMWLRTLRNKLKKSGLKLKLNFNFEVVRERLRLR